ncbi:MAG TPA: CcmD family protein [Microscillaceae bacterium]|jgi:uncharacterized membrane protein YidH (DUF202 family)|nr:CcmD family protein [Microscillaceae bacterium]
MKIIVSFLWIWLAAWQPLLAQTAMADQLRADGKIWVVVAVIVVILAAFIYYLIRLDGRISKLEKEQPLK